MLKKLKLPIKIVRIYKNEINFLNIRF